MILGPHTERLHQRKLPGGRPLPPALAPAPALSLPFADQLGEGLGGDTVPGGPAQPPGLGPGVALHEGRGVLPAPLADRGGEDGGLVSDHGAGRRGQRTAGRG